jgi:hypothetical protein
MNWTSHQAASAPTRNDPSGCASGTVPQFEWTKSRGPVSFDQRVQLLGEPSNDVRRSKWHDV